MGEPIQSAEPGLVSVVTPCFNAAEFIGETLASVQRQTHPHIEHIVVDDGSTDGSAAIIGRSADRLTLLNSGGNRGAAAARNLGAARARGEFLMFLDADDLIDPDTVRALVDALADRPRHISVCRWKRLTPTKEGWSVRRATVPFPPPSDPLAGWLEGIWVPPCAILWRRDAYDLSGGWVEDFNPNDDGDLMMRALARGARIVVASGGQSYYRMHDATRLSLSTSGFMEGRLAAQVSAFERLTRELEERGNFDPYRAAMGTAYRRLSLRAFSQGHDVIGRHCWSRAEELGGNRAVSRTWIGRLLDRLMGVERKERVAEAFARLGIMSSKRRRHRALRRGHR
jgi:O-antigen biosynthesis protein